MQADTVYKRGGATGFPAYPEPVDNASAPPVIAPFPPRFGYTHEPMTIMDVLSVTRLYGDARSQTSGYATPGYSGTARPANSWW